MKKTDNFNGVEALLLENSQLSVDKLLERYNSHPLIVNLNALEDEVAEYLNQISKIVNKK